MAIAHVHADVISRSSGKSAVAAAAYRAGDKLYDEREGKTYDYTRKREVVHSQILAPASAPDWVYHREKLWNEAEKAETRCNSRTARQIEIALPKELTREQNIALAQAYAQTLVNHGMVVDLNIHDKGDGNPHAHLMMATRSIDENGFGQKVREWDKKDTLVEWRKDYEHVTNHHLEKYGHDMRISVKSYVEQGIDQEATIHYGHYAHQLEQQGIRSERGDINRAIEALNREREAIRKEMEALQEQRTSEEAIMKQEDERKQQRTITEAELEKRFRGWVEEARQELQKESQPQDISKEQQKMSNVNQPDIWESMRQRSAELVAQREKAHEQQQEEVRRYEIDKAHNNMNAKVEALRNFVAEWTLNEQRLDRFEAIEVKRELTEKEHVDRERTLAHAEALWKIVKNAFPDYLVRGQPYIDTQEMQEDMRNAQKAADAMKSYLEGNKQFDHLQRQLEKLGVDLAPYQSAEESQKAFAELKDLIKERQAMEQRQQQQEAQQQKQDIWQKLLERSIQIENEQKASKQQAQTTPEQQPPERRLGQPRELSLEEQTRLLIESGNTSLAKFGLDDAARKQRLQDLQHELLEKARQLDKQTPLKETIDALRAQTPLSDTLRAINPPEKPVAHHASAFDTLSERLAELQAQQKLAARNEAQAQEQRKQAMERLHERFTEQLKHHYEPVPQQPKPDISKARQERSAALEAQQQQQAKVWNTLSERLAQLQAENQLKVQQEAQAQEQRQKAQERLHTQFAEQLKQHYEEVQPSHFIGAQAYERRVAKQAEWEKRKAEERQQAVQPQQSKPQESPIWKSIQERSAGLHEMEQKIAARNKQEVAERKAAEAREQQASQQQQKPKFDIDAFVNQFSQPSQYNAADSSQKRAAREASLRAERTTDFEQDWKEKVKERRQEHRHHERERRHERRHDFGRDM